MNEQGVILYVETVCAVCSDASGIFLLKIQQ